MSAISAATTNVPTLPRRPQQPRAPLDARARQPMAATSYAMQLADEEDSIVTSRVSTEMGCTPVSFGRYRLLGAVGIGGMCTVFAAHDQLLDEPVAVKRLRAGQRTAKSRAWLAHEARIARPLRHPNIIRIHGVEEQDNEAFLTMEYVDGRALSSIIDHDGPLSLIEVIRIARAIAEALAYIHANGVIHCDIKPDNILIEPGGRVVLVDFGIAQYEGATSHRGGTPGYMAPEQSAGRKVDPRTDIFGLGALLNIALMGPSLTEPSRWGGERPLPIAMARIVSSCLASDPMDRPSEMTEVLSVLDALLREIAPGKTRWPRKAQRSSLRAR